jgi:uncharacterized protein (DUF488 family)
VTTVFTVGHSTRPLAEFLDVLSAHRIALVADVRAFPASRRHPHFALEALEASLRETGVEYAWLGESLGGRRKGLGAASRHVALRDPGFRAYADHMETPGFRDGVDLLLSLASARPTAALCAERHESRCHRGLLADFLRLRGLARVLHLTDAGPATEHVPRPEARLEGERVVYDRGARSDATPLFDVP